MRFASSISAAPETAQAVRELLEPIDARLTRGMVDLALLFATGDFEEDLEDVVSRLNAAFPSAVILGCTAEGTIGCEHELERIPSMSLIAGSLPEVSLRPFYVDQRHLEASRTLFDWERIVGVSPDSEAAFIAFADPFRVNVPGFVDALNEMFPGSPVVGGVASAAREPGQNRLIVNGEIHGEGIAGVALTGRIAVDTVVSQGCRPIGRPFIITKGERNVIFELGGRTALRQLHDALVNLSTEDEALAKQALFIGRVIDEHKDRFARGDFLIHNIIGVDRVRGALGIHGHARVGATVQFHVRDGVSADEDLRAMLAPFALRNVQGVALFGCNGRGTHMWPDPGHDVGVVHELLGDVPVAGFFCHGEFGPIGGTNFIHAFTASIALFSEPED